MKLVELKKEGDKFSGTQKLSDVLGITDEQLLEIQKDFGDLTEQLTLAMQGKNPNLKNSGTILEKINKMSKEAILFGAFSAVNITAELSIKDEQEDLLGDLLRSLSRQQNDEECTDASCTSCDPSFKQDVEIK